MRKRLVAGLGLVGLLVAGCGDGGALSSSDESNAPQPSAPAPTSEAESQRSAPAKAVSVPDKCSIITESQQQALGVDQEPYERSMNGIDGCNYQNGELGTAGWGAFVGAGGARNYAEETGKRPDPTSTNEIAGYPVTAYESGIGCVLYADVSDDGLLVVNASKVGSEDSGINLCQQGEKLIEAAIENLPNA